MIWGFDTSKGRKRRREIIITFAVFCILFHRGAECFVHSFQCTRHLFKLNSNDDCCRKDIISRPHEVRFDVLFQFSTIDDDAVNNVGENSSGNEALIDETELKMQSEIQTGAELGEPDYCCLNLDDISAPFTSREYSESTFIEYTSDGLCLPAGPVGQLKEVTANFLTEPSVEIVIALVVLLNSLLVALSTLDSLSDLLPYIRNGEIIVGMIFLADFLARWFSSSRDELGFIFDPQFVVDILVVILPLAVSITPTSFLREITFLPSALSQPSGLFNLQLLRVLRLQRFLQDLDTFERFTEQALGRTNVRTNIVQDWQLQLARVVLSLFTLISVATGLIYTAEHTTNPNINNYFDALYFGLTTLTTVGFGDVSPVTSQGRLIVCGSIVFGVAVVPAQAASLLEALLDRENMRNGRVKNNGTRYAKHQENFNTGRTSSSSAQDTEEKILALDTAMACYRCGASFHWSCARYCYRCGEKIH